MGLEKEEHPGLGCQDVKDLVGREPETGVTQAQNGRFRARRPK